MRLNRPGVEPIGKEAVDEVVVEAKLQEFNGLIGGQGLKLFVVIQGIVDVNLAALFSAYLGVKDVATMAEAHFFAVGNVHFSKHFQLVVEDVIYFYDVFEQDRDDVAQRVDRNAFYYLQTAVLLLHVGPHSCSP